MSTPNPEAVPNSTTAGNNSNLPAVSLPPDSFVLSNGVVSPQSFLDSVKDCPSDPNSPHCPICLHTDISLSMKELPCGHSFHKDCLLNWLMKSDTCPMCRSKLGVDPDCPDLRNERWIRAGPNEWRSVGNGPGRWIVMWSYGVGDGYVNENEGHISPGNSGATSPSYVPTSPYYGSPYTLSSDSPPLYTPRSPNYDPSSSPSDDERGS